MGNPTILGKLARMRADWRRRHGFDDTPQRSSTIPRVVSFLVPMLVLLYWTLPRAHFGNADLWRQQSIYQVPAHEFSSYNRSLQTDLPSPEA